MASSNFRDKEAHTPSKNSGLAAPPSSSSKRETDKCLPDLSQVKKGGGGEGARKGRGEEKGEEC